MPHNKKISNDRTAHNTITGMNTSLNTSFHAAMVLTKCWMQGSPVYTVPNCPDPFKFSGTTDMTRRRVWQATKGPVQLAYLWKRLRHCQQMHGVLIETGKKTLSGVATYHLSAFGSSPRRKGSNPKSPGSLQQKETASDRPLKRYTHYLFLVPRVQNLY